MRHWVRSNTPATSEVDWMNGSRHNKNASRQTDRRTEIPAFIREKNMFRPLPPKLRIFDVDLYRSFEAQKMVFGPALVSSCITGSKQKGLEELYQKQMLRRVESILSDSSHHLQAEFQMLPSGSRFKLPKFRTNRYKHSFVPASILLLNSIKNHR